jgi:hypothetical protein
MNLVLLPSGSVSMDHLIDGAAAGRLHVSMHDVSALSSLAVSASLLHITTRSKNRFSFRLAAYCDLSEDLRKVLLLSSGD